MDIIMIKKTVGESGAHWDANQGSSLIDLYLKKYKVDLKSEPCETFFDLFLRYLQHEIQDKICI